MKWSFKIATLAGINVYAHWTFVLLFIWIPIGSLIDNGAEAAMRSFGLIFMVFSFVVLHELGHALTARRFGIRTRDITLLPIGGIARLERMPEEPREEFLVAIAGPAVNFLLATIFAAINLLARGGETLMNSDLIGADFLITAVYLNLGMGLFNLLPAFPMDGGRILRAFLTPRLGHVAATEAAASVGQFLAIVLGLLGLLTHGMLIFVAIFVYLGAQQEALQVQMKSILNGVPVREAMRTHFLNLNRDDDLTAALKEFLAGNQHDFPVIDQQQRLCGMVYREDILNNLNDEPETTPIGKIALTDCGSIPVNAMLEDALNVMQERNCSVLPVIQSGNVVGLISLENIGAFMMIQSARKRRRSNSKPFQRRSSATPSIHDSEEIHVDSQTFV
jgi:Zn-dependent protease/predicted transcriptional regulator